MTSNVHVTGIGVISAIGNSVDETLYAFKTGKGGIGAMSLLSTVHQTDLMAGEVKSTSAHLAESLNVHEKHYTRSSLLGLHAARQAIDASGIDVRAWRTGLISGTTIGGMERLEDFMGSFVEDFRKGHMHDVINHECGRSAEIIAKELGINHFVSTINTACSSSVNAIILGARMIKQGKLDVVVAGGADALSRFTLNGFNSLMILDHQLCRPFDASRNGLNLGEGGGFVVIVSDDVLRKSNMKSLCMVTGYANTNDAYHQTASSPEGRGSYDAMKYALEMAGLSHTDIDYINLHGTGTINNDLSEGTAILRLFENKIPFLSSTKSLTGHTLGASGGIEAVFSVMAIANQCLLPNLRFENAIPETGLTPVTHFANTRIKNVLSNSFGFGGNCSSIIFSEN